MRRPDTRIDAHAHAEAHACSLAFARPLALALVFATYPHARTQAPIHPAYVRTLSTGAAFPPFAHCSLSLSVSDCAPNGLHT
eukprot:784454-Pleurochrysis_carterae.AAC.1